MSKRLIALLLIAVIVFALAGCKNKGGDTDETTAETTAWDGRPNYILSDVEIKNRVKVAEDSENEYFTAQCLLDGVLKNVIAFEKSDGEIDIINSAEGCAVSYVDGSLERTVNTLFYEIDSVDGVGTEIWTYNTVAKQSSLFHEGITSNICLPDGGELAKYGFYISEGKVNAVNLQILALEQKYCFKLTEFSEKVGSFFEAPSKNGAYRTCKLEKGEGTTLNITVEIHAKNGKVTTEKASFNCLTGEILNSK